MSLLDMNMNMNMNMGFAESVSGGRLVRPRFNSDLAARLIDTAQPWSRRRARGYPLYPAELGCRAAGRDVSRQVSHLSLFTKYPPTDRGSHKKLAQGLRAVARSAGKPPQTMTQGELNDQVLGMLDLALERDPRFAEILDQDDSVGR